MSQLKKMEIEKKILKNPPAEYRTLPFWSWNGQMDQTEIRIQVKEMKSAGIGGFFMHARAGLLTPYMQEDWMKCILAAVEEAESQGMEAWCYDENGWPSGAADGVIPKMGKKYQQKWLEWRWIDASANSNANAEQLTQDRELLYLFNKIENQWVLCDNLMTNDIAYPLLAVFCQSSPHYVDLMNDEVVDVFINVCHEQYRQQFGSYFGKTMKGVFTDEPQYDRFHLPWSDSFVEAYSKIFGGEISQIIPYLLIGESLSISDNELERVCTARYQYWKIVSHRFVKSAERIGRWCREVGWEFTGHVMGENDLVAQMLSNAGVMPYYEHMDIPGIDFLGRDLKTVVITKQVSSVARQLGKKFVITETFGCCGWNLSLDEMKGIAEWQFVLGINKVCQHLESYSLEGIRKRDYPPSIFYQQPWWPSYRAFNDYFARLTYLLTLGEPITNILILHPIRTAWMINQRISNLPLDHLSEQFRLISTKLLSWQCDFDYGDEGLMEKYSKVENGRLWVGHQAYQVVILPQMIGIEGYVAEVLSDFIQQGGTVIVIGEPPHFVSGKRNNLAEKILSHSSIIHVQFNQLEELKEILPQTLLIQPVEKTEACITQYIYVQKRKMGENYLYYCVNTSATQWAHTIIHFEEEGSLFKMDMETGNEFYLGECGTTDVVFQPRQSYVFIVKPGLSVTPLKQKIPQPNDSNDPLDRLSFHDKWALRLEEPNVMTLDYAKYRINGITWYQSTNVLKIQEQCILQKEPVTIELEFTFFIDNALQTEERKEWKIAVENMERWEIHINGYPLVNPPTGWYRDRSIKTMEITLFLRKGENKVNMSSRFHCSEEVYEKFQNPHIHGYEKNKLTFDSEVESIYILGSFGVKTVAAIEQAEKQALWTEGPFTLEKLPEFANLEDATPSGLWFYAGKLFLSQEVNLSGVQQKYLDNGARFMVKWDQMLVPSCRIWVGEKLIKECLWRPFQLDLTEYIQHGKCKLTFELMTSCRNLLGPHHHIHGELYFVGPASFTDKAGWTDRGLKEIWTDRYCFVQVGLLGLRGEIIQ